MIGDEPTLLIHLDHLYGTEHDGGRADPPFDALLGEIGAKRDDDLAVLIEADGRARIRVQRAVDLDRYLLAVPDLASRPDALDAAIDMSLRWLARAGRPGEDSVGTLIKSHPALESEIRDAAALGNALCSTTRVRTTVVSETRFRALPCYFGPPTSGDELPRYRLERLLGEGAFGQVYLAVDRQLSEADHDALVSIKVLTVARGDRWERERLTDEATKARRIDHANVVRVLDRGVGTEDEDFIVYEYVDGGDLARWVRRRRGVVSIENAARMTRDIARGVHAAHMAGLVHCDLKPANIMMTKDGLPKVADFGIAIRSTETEELPEGEARQPLGNLAFISPEQFRVEPGALTVPSDVYAIGGVLYWLLSGRLPNGASYDEIQRAHDRTRGRAAPPDPADGRPEIDGDLSAICRRAMALDPSDRFASAAALADDLQAWLGRESIPWTRPTITRRLHLWMRRRPGLASLVALIIVLVLAAIATFQVMSGAAAERRMELALNEQKLDLQQKAREQFLATKRGIMARMERVRDEGIATDLLPQIWVHEWLFGPTVFAPDSDPARLWQLRMETVRRIVAEHEAEGGHLDFEALLWKTALGLWLVNGGEPAEGDRVLAEVEAGWQALLRKGDPWLADVHALRLCAQAAIQIADGASAADARAALTASALELESVSERFDRMHPGTPFDRLVKFTLEKLYRPDLLDDPERHEALRTWREEL